MSTMGESSAENCDGFGWEPVGAIDPSLVAETAQDTHYGYGRAWSRSSKYSLRADPRMLYLVHTVEGGIDFTIENNVVRTEPGQLMVLDGRAAIRADLLRETARYVWFFRPRELRPGRSLLDVHEPITLTSPAMQSLIAMTNRLLNSGQPISPEAHVYVGQAIEPLVLAALTDGYRHGEVHSMHRDGLFTAAQRVISQHFRNPEFDLSQLAEELHASRSAIHRVFASMGTSPRREIERFRLEDVERNLRHLRTLHDIVTDAGFASVRTYSAAVARSTPSRTVAGEYAHTSTDEATMMTNASRRSAAPPLTPGYRRT